MIAGKDLVLYVWWYNLKSSKICDINNYEEKRSTTYTLYDTVLKHFKYEEFIRQSPDCYSN